MEWENKTEMIRLGNLMNKDDSNMENKRNFQKYVLSNISAFDNQAWHMFSNLVQIIPEEMKKDIDFWKNAYQYIKHIDCNNGVFGITGLRIALIQTICEDELKCV